MISGGWALSSVVVAVSLVIGSASQTFAESRALQNAGLIWIEAQRGNTAAQYQLGRYYERRYWLAERDPEIVGNPADIVYAYALFSLAKSSHKLDALYGWHGTKYRVEQILGDQEWHDSIAALPEWLSVEATPPSSERDPLIPEAASGARTQAETSTFPGKQRQ